RLDGEHRRGEAGFHVADAAAEDLAVFDPTAERINGPAVACGHHVDVAVEVHDRSGPAAPRADDVDARVTGGMLGAPFRGDVLDVVRAPREIVADEMRARVVGLARRIDGRNPEDRKSTRLN